MGRIKNGRKIKGIFNLDMNKEEFSKYLRGKDLITFEAFQVYKSVGRAIRRGLVTNTGVMYPLRPFNNRGNTCNRKGKHSRAMNELRKKVYGELIGY